MKRKDTGKSKKADSVRKIGENSKREEIFQKAGAYSAVFFMAFFVALVSASAFTPVDKTNAEDLSVNLQSGGYYLQMNTVPDVTIDMTGTNGGAIKIVSSNPTLHTNCEGAKMYMSFDDTITSSTNGLYLNGNGSETANKITATSGTNLTPATLVGNTWGWAKAGAPFSDASYYTTEANWQNATFAQMPTYANAVLVYELTGNTSHTEQNAGPTLYYGVKANTALTSGTYTPAKTNSTPGKVVYTAIGSANTQEGIGISPVEGSADGGETMTISTDLYSTKPDAELLADFSATIDGEACNLTGLTRTASGALNFQCTIPAEATRNEKADVVLSSTFFGRTWRLSKSYTYLPTTFKNPDTGEPIRNMQDMSSAICAAETPPANTMKTSSRASSAVSANGYVPETILTDTRDGRKYQVRKLADGNCWMAQNLELTFYTGTDGKGYNTDTTATNTGSTAKGVSVANGKTTLTPADTDISSNLDLSNPGFNLYATQSVDGPRWSDTGETGDGTDPATGTGGTGTNGTGEGRSFSHAAYKASELYAYDNGTVNQYGQIQFGTSSAGEPQQRGGNLYNWTTATLGSGVNISAGEAPGSICPAHWQLPNNDGTRSINNLLIAYYGSSASGNPQAGSTIPSALTQMQNLMRSEPISMVVSGYYRRSLGALNGRTTYGGYVWSSTAGSSTAGSATNARVLYTDPTDFYPQGSYYRGFGLTVRCVSR